MRGKAVRRFTFDPKANGKTEDAQSLGRCAAVSRAWNIIANDELIWKDLCLRHWTTKKNVSFQLHPLVDFSKGLLRSLSVMEIKNILAVRKMNVTGIFDKSDLLAALVTSLPNYSPAQNLKWRSKWKASFIVAELDSKRTRLTVDEISNSDWIFRYDVWPQDRYVSVKFNRDGTFGSTEMMGSDVMNWRLCDDEGDVQIEDFPQLRVIRRPDWGYVLRNYRAVFLQC
ncbi:hypothetical protein HDU83_004589 [Entophlyctis luteolus]|nr:hypothetical protein HDU83_004589 [Entophlyctis luteolus]